MLGRVVFDIEEIVETAAEARIDTEQVVHLRAIAGSDDDELASVVFHALHQFLQRLGTLIVAVASLTDRCQRIGLIHEEDATHRLVAQTVHHLRGLALIGADHLGTVYLHHMAAVQITDGRQDLTQLTGDGGLTRARITSQDDVHRHLLLLTQAALGTLDAILYGVGNLADGTLHLVHTDELIQILQDIVDGTFLRHIAFDVALLHNRGRGTTADELGEDVLGGLHRQVGVAEGLVLDLHLILEEALQLVVSIGRKVGDTIAGTQAQFTDVRQFREVRRRQTEGVLEAVGHGGVALQKVVEALGQTRDDDNRVVIPLVHLHEEFIQRIHLIGILVRQQFLHIIKEEYAVLGLLDIIIPLIDKALVVDGIHHRQLGLLDNLVLVEVIPQDLCQGSLSRAGLADDDGIDRDAHLRNILTGAQESIGIDNGLQLLLHAVQPDQFVEQVLAHQRLSAPLAELGYTPVFLMTMFANHYSTSFSNC